MGWMPLKYDWVGAVGDGSADAVKDDSAIAVGGRGSRD